MVMCILSMSALVHNNPRSKKSQKSSVSAETQQTALEYPWVCCEKYVTGQFVCVVNTCKYACMTCSDTVHCRHYLLSPDLPHPQQAALSVRTTHGCAAAKLDSDCRFVYKIHVHVHVRRVYYVIVDCKMGQKLGSSNVPKTQKSTRVCGSRIDCASRIDSAGKVCV